MRGFCKVAVRPAEPGNRRDRVVVEAWDGNWLLLAVS